MDENDKNDEVAEDILQDEVEEVVEENSQDEAQEETQEEVQNEGEEEQDENAEDEQESEEVEESHEEKPSRREQLRIQQLLKKYGPPRERETPSQNINYRDMIDADDNVYQQLDQVSQDYGKQMYEAGTSKAEYLNWHTGLKIDTPIAHKRYPQLSTNDRLRDSMNEEYLSFVGYNPATEKVDRPGVSYLDYVEARFEQAQEIAETLVEKTRKNVTRQAARTGLRPDGSSPKRMDLSKDPGQMTDDELDAMIAKSGFAPKKR